MIKKAVATPKLKMVLGTDAVAGAHGHNADEIVERVRQGSQKPMDAIISATSMAAKSMRLDKTIGTLAAGYEADIVGLDGDPLTDITAVTRVAFVMKGGKVYKFSSGNGARGEIREFAITLEDLRRFAVAHSLFGPTTLKRALDRLGFVQADPIRAPARAQDLTLRHRVRGYRAGDLERRYAALGVEEDHLHQLRVRDEGGRAPDAPARVRVALARRLEPSARGCSWRSSASTERCIRVTSIAIFPTAG